MSENEDAINLDGSQCDEIGEAVFADLNRDFPAWAYDVLKRGGNVRTCEVAVASTLMGYAIALMRRRPDVDREAFVLFAGAIFDRNMAVAIPRPVYPLVKGGSGLEQPPTDASYCGLCGRGRLDRVPCMSTRDMEEGDADCKAALARAGGGERGRKADASR